MFKSDYDDDDDDVYPNLSALVTFSFKLAMKMYNVVVSNCIKPFVMQLLKSDVMWCLQWYIAGLYVVQVWRYPIRCHVTFTTALEWVYINPDTQFYIHAFTYRKQDLLRHIFAIFVYFW